METELIKIIDKLYDLTIKCDGNEYEVIMDAINLLESIK